MTGLYLAVFGLAICWVSFVQAFGPKNYIAYASRRRSLRSDLGSYVSENEAMVYQSRRRPKCDLFHGLDIYGDCPFCSVTSCYECSANYTVCKACVPGYELKEGSCSKCNTSTTINSEHCYGSCSTSNCTACYPKQTLTQQGTCITCSGYFFFNGTGCEACPEYCAKCKPNTTGKLLCTECVADDIVDRSFPDLVRGKCVNRCVHCGSCIRNGNGKVECDHWCDDGFYENKNNVCVKCPQPNCSACRWAEDKMRCEHCNEHYVLGKDGSCKKCPETCQECDLNSATNEYLCTRCLDDGFNIHQALLPNGTCQHCPTNCSECIWKNDTLKCTRCSEDLVLTNGQCLRCPDAYDCSSCTELNGAITCSRVIQINQ